LEEKRETDTTGQQMISSKAEQQTITKTQASKEKDDEPPPPPFAGLKLKPRKPVQRKPVDEPQQPFKVELKHHEFEKPPQNEEVTLRRLYTVTEHYFWTLVVHIILRFSCHACGMKIS